MSRCFPFPPPGYERTQRPEGLDLLKEAKRKEKRHKKEKKDKERTKKDKDKEKDGSDEKQRDKRDRKGKHKDKKERHRDKKKDKEERGKDKEKSSISEDSSVAGKHEEKSGEKLHPEEGRKERNCSMDEGKVSSKFHGQNGERSFQSSLSTQENVELIFVQELDRRIRDDEKVRGSQLPDRAAIMGKSDQQMEERDHVRNSSGVLAQEKGNDEDQRVDGKMDPQRFRDEINGNAMSQNLTSLAKSKVERIPRAVEKQNGWRLEGKEKYKEKCDDKWGDKHKDRHKESLGKDKNKEKEKKKEEGKRMVKTENNKNEQEKFNDVGKSDLVGFIRNKSTELLNDTNSRSICEGNIRKRKDMDTNGFLHDSEIRPPNKIPRPAPYQLTQNGRKLEPFRTPTSSHKHTVPYSVPLDSKEGVTNGIIEAHKPSLLKPGPSSAAMISYQNAEALKIPHRDSNQLKKKALTVLEDQIAEVSRRPPHPDSKYLDKVLTVPKVGVWSEDDDCEWLFGKKVPSDKPDAGSVRRKEDTPVWSEAVHIESLDIYALPYVIPY